jgi:glycosyltransferase involved in cell wall biosynthesis
MNKKCYIVQSELILMPIRIALFSDSINIPPKEGINVHTYDLLNALAARPDCAPILIVCDRGWLDADILAAQAFDTILVPENDFYNVAYISDLLKAHSIDIAQSYMTYFGAVVLGPAALEAGVPCVAELHDLEESVVGVYFADNELPQAVQDHTEFQQQAAAYASLVRVMSRYDYDIIKSTWQNYTDERYFCMPVSRFGHKHTGDLAGRSEILYIGNMSYAPNAEGAQVILDSIVPFSKRKFTFIGRGSENYSHSQIAALGMVDDIEPHLVKAALGVAPILQGSGMKIKNLTYLSYGVPLITTTLGAQGFAPSEAIIIEDDFSRWSAIIEDIMADENKLAQLSKTARAYFEHNFEITRTSARLVELYKAAIDTYSTIAPSLLQPMNAKHTSIDLRHVYWLRELREKGQGAVTKSVLIKGRGA